MEFLQIAVVTLVVVTATSGCPDGWVRHEQTCYHFSHDTETFIGAEAICKDWDAHLVEIEDRMENAFLGNHAKLVTYKYLIALTDLQEEGVWRWHGSQAKPTFLNWRSGEPDNYHNDENCADIAGDGTWGDLPCHELKHYICEMAEQIPEVVG